MSGRGVRQGSVTVFPVWTAGAATRGLVTGRTSSVVVSEADGGPAVNRLHVRNGGRRPLLLLEGRVARGRLAEPGAGARHDPGAEFGPAGRGQLRRAAPLGRRDAARASGSSGHAARAAGVAFGRFGSAVEGVGRRQPLRRGEFTDSDVVTGRAPRPVGRRGPDGPAAGSAGCARRGGRTAARPGTVRLEHRARRPPAGDRGRPGSTPCSPPTSEPAFPAGALGGWSSASTLRRVRPACCGAWRFGTRSSRASWTCGSV